MAILWDKPIDSPQTSSLDDKYNETPEDKLFNEKLEPAFKDNPEVGTVGIYNKYTRLTFVCYLREKIAQCPDEIDERFLTKSGHSKIKEKPTQEVI